MDTPTDNPRIELITCGKPTANTGRTYPHELMDQVEGMFEKSGGQLPVDSNLDNPHLDLDYVTHIITEVIREGDTMFVRMKDAESGPLPRNVLSLSPMGTGKVDEDGIVSDYTLTKISVIPTTRILY